jgi:hypothetical protein
MKNKNFGIENKYLGPRLGMPFCFIWFFLICYHFYELIRLQKLISEINWIQISSLTLLIIFLGIFVIISSLFLRRTFQLFYLTSYFQKIVLFF